MVCPITYGDHNKFYFNMEPRLQWERRSRSSSGTTDCCEALNRHRLPCN